jgi:hypothetical protein
MVHMCYELLFALSYVYVAAYHVLYHVSIVLVNYCLS